MTSSSKEFPAAMKALKGLTSGACDGNKFIGSVSASRQQYCKTIGSRPSQVEVQLVDASNRTTAALQAGSADEPGPATAGIGRHLLQQPAAASAAADEGFVVANLAPFDAIVTLKDALGSPVNETDVPVDVSLQSRGTAIRQPPAVPSPSGQYSLPGVGALSSNIGLQRVAAVATMGEQRVAVQELPLYIRRCGPGEISMDNGGPGDPVVCKYCGPSQAGNTRAQVSFNPGNSSCDACPDGAFFCDGLLLTPLDDHWQSHPFSLLEVISTDPAAGTVRARCKNTAMLGERKNVNLPGVVVDLPTLTEKDVDDLVNWGVAFEIDLIAASFVRKGSDLDYIREVMGEKGRYIKIISKVENQEGIQNFDEILAKTDGVMVARGDLGMEIPTEKIFLAQKMMIQKCNYAGKPVITATQMLESMIKNPRPTRAEATDVANAVLDGTDCVMLSGETAAGSFPVEAVKVMTKICREAEASLDYYAMFKNILKQAPLPMSPLESLASSAVRTAHKVHASLIVVLTRGGSTARLVAKYRPLVPVLTVAVPVLTTDSLTWTCSNEAPARQCLVTRGLIPLLAEGSARATDTDTTDEILAAAIEHAKKMRYCTKGDSIVALHRIGNASVIKIVDIK